MFLLLLLLLLSFLLLLICLYLRVTSSHVTLQIGVLDEGFITLSTGVGSLTGVLSEKKPNGCAKNLEIKEFQVNF